MMRHLRRKRFLGQTGVEYMLAISVVVTSIYAAFYLLRGPGASPSNGPAAKSFNNLRKTIERPYPQMLVLESLAIAAVLVAAVTDLLEHKIHNLLTFPMMAAGIVGFALSGDRWWEGLAATVAVGAPFFVLYAFNVLKAGDVKLYMAVGALLGLEWGGKAALLSVILWFPIGIGVFALNRKLSDLRGLFSRDYKPLLVPFGAAIALGTIVAVRLRYA